MCRPRSGRSTTWLRSSTSTTRRSPVRSRGGSRRRNQTEALPRDDIGGGAPACPLSSPFPMIPDVLHLGPIPIHVFGIFLALAFLAASAVASREFARKGHDPA